MTLWWPVPEFHAFIVEMILEDITHICWNGTDPKSCEEIRIESHPRSLD